jgi:hypothetical protein
MTPWGWIFKQGLKVLKHPRLRPHALRGLVTAEELSMLDMLDQGYLAEIGWVRSRREQRCIDRSGAPLPWCTYPFIQFIEPRLTKALRVFEFGSGYSTLFYGARTKEVHAVEHDAEWVDILRPQLPENVHLEHLALELDGAYCRQAQQAGGLFDVIVVDGRDRVNCLKQSVSMLSEGGVMVLDNAQREKYHPGIGLMLEAGFRQLDFHGISPLKAESNITTLFYRPGNVLGI